MPFLKVQFAQPLLPTRLSVMLPAALISLLLIGCQEPPAPNTDTPAAEVTQRPVEESLPETTPGQLPPSSPRLDVRKHLCH